MTNSSPDLCRQAEEWINLRLDGELANERALQLDRHLSGCPSCQREFRMARGLEKLFTCLELPAAEEAKRKARQRASALVLRSGPRVFQLPKSKPAPWRRSGLWAAAALVGLMLLAGGYGWYRHTSGGSPGVAALNSRFQSRSQLCAALEKELGAALQAHPGRESIASVQRLAEDLAAGLGLADQTPSERRALAAAYVRVLHLALIPGIRQGLLGPDFRTSLQGQDQVLRLAEEGGGGSDLAAARSLNAYARELVSGLAPEAPLVGLPLPDPSFPALIGEAILAAGRTAEPAGRIAELSGIAEQMVLATESPRLPLAERIALQRCALGLSERGIQALVRDQLRAEPSSGALGLSLVLEADRARLDRLERGMAGLPGPERQALGQVLQRSRSANKALQAAVEKTIQQGKGGGSGAVPDPSNPPIAAIPSSASQGSSSTGGPDLASPTEDPGTRQAAVGRDEGSLPAGGPGLADPAVGGEQPAGGLQVPVPASTGTSTGLAASNPGQGFSGKNQGAVNPGASGAQAGSSDNVLEAGGNPGGNGSAVQAAGAPVKGVQEKTAPGRSEEVHVRLAEHSQAGQETSKTDGLSHQEKLGASASRPDRPSRSDRPVDFQDLVGPGKMDRPSRPERPRGPERLDRPERPEPPTRNEVSTVGASKPSNPGAGSGNGGNGNSGGNPGNGGGGGNPGNGGGGGNPGNGGGGGGGGNPGNGGGGGNPGNGGGGGNPGNGGGGGNPGNGGGGGNPGNGGGGGIPGNGGGGGIPGNGGGGGNPGNGGGGGNPGNGGGAGNPGNGGGGGNPGNGNPGKGNAGKDRQAGEVVRGLERSRPERPQRPHRGSR